MDLRRILLALAVGVLVAALAASIVGPTGSDRDAPPAPPSPPAGEGEEPIDIEFSAAIDDVGEEASVEAGRRVILTVSSDTPGEVQLQGLGRVAPVEPGTAAVFDLLPERPGRYDAVFDPAQGLERRAGTLVVE